MNELLDYIHKELEAHNNRITHTDVEYYHREGYTNALMNIIEKIEELKDARRI